MAGTADFESFAGQLDEPVYIVTVAHAGTRAGCLIGFGGQVSIDPPRFLACLSDKNRTFRVASGAEHLGVHLIPADRHDLAELFGGRTGDEIDKFARCAWRQGPRGVPLLDDCPTWFVGRVHEQHRLGDHVGFLLDPVAAAAEDEPWLARSAVSGLDAGHGA
jgi:flavin reductase (DIM6/NTAB) family NADH-FMN oxidoreductase RutF